MNAFNGMWAVAAKELLHLKRDPATLVIALLIPVIQLTIFGFAIDFDVRHISTVIVDLDRSTESRSYVDSLRTTDYLQIKRYLTSPEEAEDAMRRGDARVAVIIPPDFGRRAALTSGATPSAAAHGPAQVRVLIDGSDNQVAIRARMAFLRPAVDPTLPEARINMLYNPDMKTTTFMIPGLIGVILQLVTVALTSFSLVREREQGTLEQLMVSPIGRLGLMVGKVIPYALIGLVEVVSVLIMGRIVFDVHVAGSVALLILLSIPFIIAALSLGLLISTVAQNQAQALQLTLLITMPSILMSGFMFPLDTMPGPLYMVSMAIPVTYFMQILRGVVVRGAGFYDLWPSVLALIVISTILLTVSTMRFRKTLA
ncbi:MAG TPA: ABC transporter permease [Capsulimonadaceae bacterium]|jgi:ABC-type multidrug transport system permease subunit